MCFLNLGFNLNGRWTQTPVRPMQEPHAYVLVPPEHEAQIPVFIFLRYDDHCTRKHQKPTTKKHAYRITLRVLWMFSEISRICFSLGKSRISATKNYHYRYVSNVHVTWISLFFFSWKRKSFSCLKIRKKH